MHVATINEGGIFGELALTSVNSERKATIICDEQGKKSNRICLAYLTKKDFDHAIKKGIKEKQKRNSEFLSEFPLFANNFLLTRFQGLLKEYKTVKK